MTENTGRMDVGEGVLWRSKVNRRRSRSTLPIR